MPRTRPDDTVDLQVDQTPGGLKRRIGGLTKREYFSIKALQGLLAKFGSYKSAAEEATTKADELINELNKDA